MAKWSGCDRWAPCCAPVDLVDDGPGHVGAEPVHGAAVMRPATLGPPMPKTAGTSSASHVERRVLAAHELRRSATSAGPSARRVRPPLVGQARPGLRAHHPAEEPLDLVSRVLGQRRPIPGAGPSRPRVRRNPSHGIGGSKAPMASKARGSASAAPITTSPPRLCPIATTGPAGPGRARSLGPPRPAGRRCARPGPPRRRPATPDSRAGRRPPSSTSGSRRITRRKLSPRSSEPWTKTTVAHRVGGRRPRRDVEGGRVAHEQGRRYRPAPVPDRRR